MHNTDDGFDAKVIHDIENVQIGWSFIAAPLFDVRHTVLQICSYCCPHPIGAVDNTTVVYSCCLQ